MTKYFLGVSWRGKPWLGITLKLGENGGRLEVEFLGIDLFGLQFKKEE